MDDYDRMAIRADIRRINSRLKAFKKQGWTDTRQYRALVEKLENAGFSFTDKGFLSKKGVDTLTDAQYEKLESIVRGKNTVGAAISYYKKYAEEWGLDTDDESLKALAKTLDDVHEVIMEKKDEIYATSEDLTAALHRSSNLSYEEVEEILTQYGNHTRLVKQSASQYDTLAQKRIDNIASKMSGNYNPMI